MAALRPLPNLQENMEWSFNRMSKENEEIKDNKEVKSSQIIKEGESSKFVNTDGEGKDVKDNKSVSGGGVKKGQRKFGGRRRDKKRSSKEENADGPVMIEKVISIKRITKVTKGGKKLSFSALVVVGDGKRYVGYSLSKALEVAVAIRKAMGIAKKNMIEIPLDGTTIPHEVIGRCSGSRVLLKPASEGTGVIASGPVRAVCDGAGIHNILTKCHRSNNPINVVKATIEGLSRLKRVEDSMETENAVTST